MKEIHGLRFGKAENFCRISLIHFYYESSARKYSYQIQLQWASTHGIQVEVAHIRVGGIVCQIYAFQSQNLSF